MLRLLWWFVRVVVVGKGIAPRCARGCWLTVVPWPLPAAPYCEHRLCADCCEGRCKCLKHQIDSTKELRKELAA
jgi:hypothetical protein